MAVVIRLRGLPVSAGSSDIRHFFVGLTIPDGGVHIVGGKLGEAFIIFATDEDARRAMSRTGIIKNSHIQLFLSSKAEMQSTLEKNRKSNRKHPAVPPDGEAGNMPMNIKKGNPQNKFERNNLELNAPPAKYDRKEVKPSKDVDDVYVFLYGLPYSATEMDIRKFFSGLDVVEIIFQLRPNGFKNGNGLVKFGSKNDATAAVDRNNEYMGNRFISVKKTSEEQWVNSGGQVGGNYSKQQFRKQRTRSRSPLKTRSRSPQNQPLYIHLKNLPYNLDVDDLKMFLGLPDLPNSQIKLLLDGYQQRTREGFVMVKNQSEYWKCLSLDKHNLNGRPIFILPIERKTMLDLIESSETKGPPTLERSPHNPPPSSRSNAQRCIYVRNFPFDVTKSEVLKFFSGFTVREEDIFLLFDNKGVGLGEALVKFPSEQQAFLAESLNRQRFLGTEVLLRRISDDQVKEFGVYIEAPVETILANSPLYREDVGLRGQSYGLPNDIKYGRGEFRGSPERFHGPNPMRIAGQEEFVDRFDMGNKHSADYYHSLPVQEGDFDKPTGGLVHMKNLPYKVTTAEILDFFYGYHIAPDSVDVKFDRDGMARGLATVYFESFDDARAAVHELNGRPIGERNISLHFAKA